MKSGNLNFLEPSAGLSRPVTGLLYLYLFIIWSCEVSLYAVALFCDVCYVLAGPAFYFELLIE